MEKEEFPRIVRNDEVAEICAEIPAGHRHLRTTITLDDGTALTFQEATIAALVRAYIAVKTDPLKSRVVLKGRRLTERKMDYAEWQLMEE